MRSRKLSFSFATTLGVAILVAGLAPGSVGGVIVPTPKIARWATVLCQFEGKDTKPHPKSYYENLMSNERPGMEHYFEDVSYGRLDLRPSEAFGWFELPHRQAYYNRNEPYEVPENAWRDCMKAADRRVHFPDYFGINLWFNGKLANRGWGISRYVRIDGRGKNYGITIMSEPSTWEDDGGTPNGILAHEMGHGFQLQHSAGRYRTYYSHWDLMGTIGQGCGYDFPEEFFCIPVHPIAFHKFRLGWITAADSYVGRAGTSRTIRLVPLSHGPQEGAYLWARIPLDGKHPGYLTIEARALDGYDDQLRAPGAIIIHRWDRTATQATGDHPYMIDTDGGGSSQPNGERWIPGETFVHKSGASVSILAQNEDGSYNVTIAGP